MTKNQSTVFPLFNGGGALHRGTTVIGILFLFPQPGIIFKGLYFPFPDKDGFFSTKV